MAQQEENFYLCKDAASGMSSAEAAVFQSDTRPTHSVTKTRLESGIAFADNITELKS
jgi:hypothetical protein